MRPLLEHGEGEVRARACNLIGNLCRYNTFFYEAISAAGLIEVLIDRCRDFDRSTRKFACFAIGNAGAPLCANPRALTCMTSCVMLWKASICCTKSPHRKGSADPLGSRHSILYSLLRAASLAFMHGVSWLHGQDARVPGTTLWSLTTSCL